MFIYDRKGYEDYRDAILYYIEKLGRFAEFTLAKFKRRI